MPAESPAFSEGAPDIVFEVISPSSVRVDRHIKFGAYEQAGVTEYWRIDPATRSVEVYVLARQEYALLGQFSGEAVARSQVLPELEVPVSELFVH
jgi:Uma2 family endonuclease